MATIALNTSSLNTSALLSIPSMQFISKKATSSKQFLSYTFAPKKASRKSLSRLFSMDWDLNMNELEFE